MYRLYRKKIYIFLFEYSAFVLLTNIVFAFPAYILSRGYDIYEHDFWPAKFIGIKQFGNVFLSFLKIWLNIPFFPFCVQSHVDFKLYAQ